MKDACGVSSVSNGLPESVKDLIEFTLINLEIKIFSDLISIGF